MVQGISKFKEYFSDYSDFYVIIGGTACDIIMGNYDNSFRATKDFDVVLIMEICSDDFFKRIWQFITDGEYKNKQKSNGLQQFYRFTSPKSTEFPFMIELFAGKPESIELNEYAVLTPIPTGDNIPSLSAILMDDEYYNLLIQGRIIIDGVSVLKEEYLILYKIKAWLNLFDRKAAGESIDSREIKKHKNDIFRLLTIIIPSVRINISDKIKIDIKRYIELVSSEPITLKNLNITVINFNEALNMIKKIYLLV